MMARGGFSFSSRSRNCRTAAPAPSDLDEDALRGIQHPALEAKFLGQPINERAESDALNGSANSNLGAFVVVIMDGASGGR